MILLKKSNIRQRMRQIQQHGAICQQVIGEVRFTTLYASGATRIKMVRSIPTMRPQESIWTMELKVPSSQYILETVLILMVQQFTSITLRASLLRSYGSIWMADRWHRRRMWIQTIRWQLDLRSTVSKAAVKLSLIFLLNNWHPHLQPHTNMCFLLKSKAQMVRHII